MAESKMAGEGSSDNHEDWPEVELTWGTQMKKEMKREWPEANPVQRNDKKKQIGIGVCPNLLQLKS